MILPDGKMGKVVNFSFSLFLLVAMFSGIFFKDFSFEENVDLFYEIDDVSERLEKLRESKTIGEVEKKLTQMVKQDLLMKNIVPLKILINININDKSSILINRMEIFMKEGEEYDEDVIKKIIVKKYGIEPDIIV